MLTKLTFLNYLFGYALLISFSECNIKSGEQKSISLESNAASSISKPGSTNHDTLTIFTPAAVFYYPDAVQKLHIMQSTERQQYEAIMHEFESLINYSKSLLARDWPKVPITDVETARYLRFILKDHSSYILDLDKIQDPIGLILCSGNQNPSPVDMSNLESLAGRYLN
ncbi:MAG: hypothetical protein K1X68_10330 [Saprospiraceae bacterium]|nr:hypothetical protein [Saprospiraceae bacterium]HMW39341.1 hypothetical protein [Saprospiraceae bacterium]HMX89675.1 hypothetical protein [Saprospiraceae bacterium]HMZ41398.1 hypothetical protein [Saprospiraceae bacterium]HNA63784.1 hypothetical protein [Saprospiraceae bacterium]